MALGLFSSVAGVRDVAVDLGTANTLVYARGEGIVVSEPSVVAVDADTGAVHAVGSDAERMIGRTPATITATRPLRHGVIADFDVTEQMLRYFLRRLGQGRFAHPRVVMCVPSAVTDVEKRAVEEACRSAGARDVALIEEPLAAAIGAGLEIAEPSGKLIVDIGGGTSDVALISLGGIVVSRSLRSGGFQLDEALLGYVRRVHNLALGQRTAEQLKVDLGSAHELEDELQGEVRGRDLVSGLPRAAQLTSEETREALAEPVGAIIEAVTDTLERTPPELASDIADRGIMLAGGGALLRGLADRLRAETGMPASLVESPLTCVAVGAGRALEDFDAIARSASHHHRRPRLRFA
ncbi:MAG: rod shape-determining protein [Actinobacteria bacterium]|nr:rod shape-determining protein [Actinomycetota bacterium]